MQAALIFILLIFFVWLKGLSSEPARKPTQRRFSPAVSPLKARIQQQKLSNFQTRRSTTTAPIHNQEEFLNHFKIDDVNDEYYDYDIPEENPFFPEYDHNGEGHDHQFIHPQNFQHKEEFPGYDYDGEPDYSDMEEEPNFPVRKRTNKKTVRTQAWESNGQSVMPRLVRKEKHPVKKKDKNKYQLNNVFGKLNEEPESDVKKKNKVMKKKFNKKLGDWQKKQDSWKEKKKFGFQKNENKVSKKKKPKGGKYMSNYEKRPFKKPDKSSIFEGYKSKDKNELGSWKEKLKFGSQINENKVSKKKKPKGGKYVSYEEKKALKKPEKSSMFKGFKSKDANDDYNRLVKKSINDSSPEGITYFPTETTESKIPELPTAQGVISKRNEEVKRQAMEEDEELTEEPPNALKPGAFKAEMFHERVIRKGSSGNADNVLYRNEKLPLEKRRVVANNPARRRRKHIEANFPENQFFPINKRRLVKKDVYTPFPMFNATATNFTVEETTFLDAPTTVFGTEPETEPPITGEVEPPTTMMVKKRADNKRFVGPRYVSQTHDFNEPISKVTNQEFENFYEQKGMHLVKLIYRIKEQELESIFDTLNISSSTEIGESLTTPALEDVVKMQSSVIQQLVHAIDEKKGSKTDRVRNHPSHKKDRNVQIVAKNRTNIAPDNDFDREVFSSIENKAPDMQSVETSNLSGIDLKTALQLLYQIYKSKNNHGSSSVTKMPTTRGSKPVTEILIKNLLKNPAFLQQFMSRNSNKSEVTAPFLTPNMLQLLSTSVLKTADKVEKNEVMEKGAEEKAVFKENQNLDGKLSKNFGDKPKAEPAVNPEKAAQFHKDLPTTEGNVPDENDKKVNPEKLKQILLQLLKHPSLVQRSNINRRKVRDSILKSKQIIGRAPRLTTAETTRNATPVIASEVSMDSEESTVSDQDNNIRDSTTEDPNVEDEDEYEDESTTNLYVLTKSSIASKPETADDTEDGDGDSVTEERDEPVESEFLTENDTTLPTEHS